MYPIIIYIYPYENGLMTIPIWLYNLTFDMNMLALWKGDNTWKIDKK